MIRFSSLYQDEEFDGSLPDLEMCEESVSLALIGEELLEALSDVTKTVTITKIATESGMDSVFFEGYSDDSTNALGALRQKLAEFGEKIIELWDGFITWIRTQMHTEDYTWYHKIKHKIEPAMKNTGGPKTVKAYKYAQGITDPGNVIMDDIIDMTDLLNDLYDVADEIMRSLIGDRSSEYIDKIKREYDADTKESLRKALSGNWYALGKKIGLKTTESNVFAASEVRNAIMEKYFGTSSPEKEEVDISVLIPSVDAADAVLDPSNTKSLFNMCQTIKNGSTKCVTHLRFVDQKLDSSEIGTEAKVGSLYIVRTALAVCNAIGQTYWKVYLNARSDVKRAIKTIVKANKQNEGESK